MIWQGKHHVLKGLGMCEHMHESGYLMSACATCLDPPRLKGLINMRLTGHIPIGVAHDWHMLRLDPMLITQLCVRVHVLQQAYAAFHASSPWRSCL